MIALIVVDFPVQMKKIFFIIGVILTMAKGVQAQTCQVPVSEADEPMMKGSTSILVQVMVTLLSKLLRHSRRLLA